MTCRPGPDRRPRGWRALALAALLLPTSTVRGADRPDESEVAYVSSEVWLPAFVVWVDRSLVREQHVDARDRIEAPAEDAAIELLDELVLTEIQNLPAALALPASVIPPLNAQGITGKTLDAARVYATGATGQEEALHILGQASLERDPLAAHLRAQLLDESRRGAEPHPHERLEVIDGYREALRLGPDAGPAQRAWLRIGQIYLEIDFGPEARAALQQLSDQTVADDLRSAVRVSLTEAAIRDGKVLQALEELEQLKLEPLRKDARLWAHRRRGDVLAALGRYPPAADEYRRALELLSRGSSPDDAFLLRLALAHLESGDPERAERLAERIEPGASAEAALAGLIRAGARRAAGDPKRAVQEALAIVTSGTLPGLAALGGVAVLEGERLRGRASPAIPPGTSQLLRSAPSAPGLSLLAYTIARLTGPGDTPADLRRRLGELAITLPEGPVRRLVEKDLTQRLASKLVDFLFYGVEPDAQVLRDLEAYVHPSRASEDLLLLGMETFARSGNHTQCNRWARSLQAREVRPIRRGLAVWRESLCSGGLSPDARLGVALVRIADSGEAGAFSIPLVTLAAEGELRSGNREQALELYERALEGFGTPDVVGPVLIRVGELRAGTDFGERTTRPVLRGLALLDPDLQAARAFRTVGIVTLLRAALREKPSQAVRTSVRSALRTAPVAWQGLLRYLASRAKIVDPPTGDGLFARAAREVRRAERFVRQTPANRAPRGLSSARGKR